MITKRKKMIVKTLTSLYEDFCDMMFIIFNEYPFSQEIPILIPILIFTSLIIITMYALKLQ